MSRRASILGAWADETQNRRLITPLNPFKTCRPSRERVHDTKGMCSRRHKVCINLFRRCAARARRADAHCRGRKDRARTCSTLELLWHAAIIIMDSAADDAAPIPTVEVQASRLLMSFREESTCSYRFGGHLKGNDGVFQWLQFCRQFNVERAT